MMAVHMIYFLRVMNAFTVDMLIRYIRKSMVSPL